MNIVVIDGEKCNTAEDFHNELQRILDLPDYYGGNLDALWDCLTAWVELPLTIQWINFTESKLKLGDYATNLLELSLEARKEIDGFEIQIKD